MARSEIVLIEEVDAIETEHDMAIHAIFRRSIYDVVGRDAFALCDFALSRRSAHISVVANAEVEFPTWELDAKISVSSVAEDVRNLIACVNKAPSSAGKFIVHAGVGEGVGELERKLRFSPSRLGLRHKFKTTYGGFSHIKLLQCALSTAC